MEDERHRPKARLVSAEAELDRMMSDDDVEILDLEIAEEDARPAERLARRESEHPRRRLLPLHDSRRDFVSSVWPSRLMPCFFA